MVTVLRRCLCALLLCACSTAPAKQTRAAQPSSLPADPAPGVSAGASARTAAASPTLAPAVRITAEASARDAVAVRVQNHAAEHVQLAAELQLERRDASGYVAVAGEHAVLRAAAGATGCVELSPGAEQQPVFRAQPGTRAGTYRFRAHECGGARRPIDGEPFELP